MRGPRVDENPALLQLELSARPAAAGPARNALGSLNGSLHLISEARLQDAELLVTELVSNAVGYGSRPGEEVGIVVHATPGVLRLEVQDLGSSFDPGDLSAPTTERGGGWRLQIIASWRIVGAWPSAPGQPCGPRSIVPKTRPRLWLLRLRRNERRR